MLKAGGRSPGGDRSGAGESGEGGGGKNVRHTQGGENSQELFGLSTQEEGAPLLFQLYLGWPVNVLHV